MKNKILFFLILLFFAACKTSNNTPNVDQIKVDINLHRFDQDFFNTTISSAEKIAKFPAQYGTIWNLFLEKTSIIEVAHANGNLPATIDGYINMQKVIYDTAQQKFQNLGWLETDLKKGFQYYKYYFPNYKVPQIFTMVDGFYKDQSGSITGIDYDGQDTVLIGLQLYFGNSFPGYDPEVYPQYIINRFDKKYMVRNVFATIIAQQFKTLELGSPLIDHIIDAGKKMYLLDKLLPFVPEEIKLTYTKTQVKDCYANEQLIWSDLINNNLLFSTEPTIIKDYVGENPFTKSLGTDSPGNIANFVGLQIVRKYMAKNPNLTLAQLMSANPKNIYIDAKYKPS